MSKKMEVKAIGGHVLETKEFERDGVKLGQISGYIATFDIDRGFFGVRDRFMKGAFIESIQEHKANRNRQVRFKDNHGRVVGGFPIASVHEDETGLFGVAEVNLDVQQGAEVFSLAKQGVLVDFSIGFSAIDFETETIDEDDKIRNISKAKIWEGSIVGEPMNPKAVVTSVKSLTDTVERLLIDQQTLSEDQISEILTELKAIKTTDDIELIEVSDVESIEDLKGLEKLLKSKGFSDKAATTLVKVAHDLKAGNQGDLETGDEETGDNQGDLESQEILTLVKSMNDDITDSQILNQLKQIKR